VTDVGGIWKRGKENAAETKRLLRKMEENIKKIRRICQKKIEESLIPLKKDLRQRKSKNESI